MDSTLLEILEHERELVKNGFNELQSGDFEPATLHELKKLFRSQVTFETNLEDLPYEHYTVFNHMLMFGYVSRPKKKPKNILNEFPELPTSYVFLAPFMGLALGFTIALSLGATQFMRGYEQGYDKGQAQLKPTIENLQNSHLAQQNMKLQIENEKLNTENKRLNKRVCIPSLW